MLDSLETVSVETGDELVSLETGDALASMATGDLVPSLVMDCDSSTTDCL